MEHVGLFLLVIIFCLVLEGFFAGAETAIMSVKKLKIKYLAETGNKRAKKLRDLLDNPKIFLSTVLIGVNIAVIIGSAFASRLVSSFVPQNFVSLCTTLFVLPLALFFGEIVPKVIARLYSTKVSLHSVRPLYLSYYLLYPFVKLFSWLSEKIAWILGVNIVDKDDFVSRKELLYLLEDGTSESDVDSKIIKKIFNFRHILTNQIMVPLSKVKSVDASTTCREVLETMHKSGYSRIPVYDRHPRRIVGLVRPTDLINADMDKLVSRYMVIPYKVKENSHIINLLWNLQMKGRQMVVIENTFKSAVGILTLEDIMEKVVGSINDEYDVLTDKI